ncbi:MAG TPA: SH3 domain-containing protein [Candidatus Rifleibacterium sp.]|nr:SH3 domain-containing protein [Candidatus Rifleibacterium sp.]HPT44880.1 SH3 domain-containing protein [Candidatus Rifleibacterium sp.]
MKKAIFSLALAILISPFSAAGSGADAGSANPFNVDQVNISASASVKGSGNSSNAVITSAAPAIKEGTIGYVNVNTRLNVRTAPWGKIIGKLYDGDKLRIVAREGDWLKIHYNGGYAYVHSNYVEVGEERANKPSSDNGSNTPTPGVPDGTLDPARFGYDSKRFNAVFDIVEKFCSSNKAYVFGAGHKKTSGYAEKTDCSGFVGQFIQKMAAASGIPPVFPANSWYPSSQIYKNQYTNKVTSTFPPPSPRDSIKPGDVFVMNPGSSGIGHVGLFMGYTSSGQPIIAHSTPTRVQSGTRIAGKVGYSGVRIEVLPSRYKSRWAGVYRIKNMDSMLNKLSGS